MNASEPVIDVAAESLPAVPAPLSLPVVRAELLVAGAASPQPPTRAPRPRPPGGWDGFQPTGRAEVDRLLGFAGRFCLSSSLIRDHGARVLQTRWTAVRFDDRHRFVDAATAVLNDHGWTVVANGMPARGRDRMYSVLLIVASTRLLRKARAERRHASKLEVDRLARTISGIRLPYLRPQAVAEHLQELLALRDDAKRSRESKIEDDRLVEIELKRILPRIAEAMKDD